MKKKVCVITGSRAEFGLLRWVMDRIKYSSSLELSTVVIGSHLSSVGGHTTSEIITSGFAIDAEVEMNLDSDSAIGIAKSIGLGIIGCADALARIQPDVVVLLGDRFEIFAAATSTMVRNTPILHIHGGELTHGAIDDQFRHAITKMSNIHCVSSESHRDRVIQMGELPQTVHVVGGLGIEAAQRVQPQLREDIEHRLEFKFQEKNFMLVFHPETSTVDKGHRTLDNLLTALESFPEVGVLVSMPNLDTGNRAIRNKLLKFATARDHATVFSSLGQDLFISTLKFCTAIVGNSSSGLLEAPAVGIPTVNVGLRQEGRPKPESVLDVSSSPADIAEALRMVCTHECQETAKRLSSEFGQSYASERIVHVLEDLATHAWVQKEFHDLPRTGK